MAVIGFLWVENVSINWRLVGGCFTLIEEMLDECWWKEGWWLEG